MASADSRLGRSNSALSTKSVDNEEMMVIEINFGKNKKDDIIVHFGDNPVLLAEAFAKKHGLKAKVVSTIANHIIQTVEDHLSKAEAASPILDDVTESLSPKVPSLKSIFKADSTNQSFEASEEQNNLSFGVSPIRDTLSVSADVKLVDIKEDTSQKALKPSDEPPLSSPSAPKKSIISSYDPSKSFGGTMMSPRKRNPSDDEMKTPRSGGGTPRRASPSPLRNPKVQQTEYNLNAVSGEYENGKFRSFGSYDRIEDRNYGTSAPTDTIESEAAVYDSMKSSWKAGSVKKTERQFEKKMASVKKKEGLIVATSFSSKSSTQRAAIFSGRQTSGSTRHITANERLYQGASVRKQRLDAKINESMVSLDNELALGRENIKVKGKSKEIIATLSQRDSDIDISQRLYAEAAMLRETKLRREQKEAGKPKQEMWSCPICCTYHEPPKSHMYKADKTKVCTACGWSGVVDDLPFKPVAIDLQYQLAGTDRHEMIWNSYKRRGIENFPVKKSEDFNIFEYLHRDSLHQKEKVLLMQNKWNDEENLLTFKPEIPEESRSILLKKTMTTFSESTLIDGTLSVTATETAFSRDAHERLHNTTITCQDDKFLAEQRDKGKVFNAMEHRKFVDRLTYEYIDRANRQEELRKMFLETDQRTGQPLFKPKVPGLPLTHVMHLDDDDSTAWTDASGSVAEDRKQKEKIYDKLLRRGEEHRMRMKKIQEDMWEKEAEEMKAHMKHSLPESIEILEKSSENSIGEIFKVLLTCQMHDEAKAGVFDQTEPVKGLNAEVLLKISMELSNWREGVLNIAQCDPEMMIESVQSLLTEIIALSKTRNCNEKYPSICEKYEDPTLVDFETFTELVWKCIEKREGGGKSYLFLPRREISPKKPEEVPSFMPEIDSKSRDMVSGRRDASIPIEEKLLSVHEQQLLRFEDLRQDIEREKFSECTFQPRLYRPSRAVQPRIKYYHVDAKDPAPPPPPRSPSKAYDSKVAKPAKASASPKRPVAARSLVVSASRVSVPKAIPPKLSPAQDYDFENESIENSNDSLTIPRHSIASALTLDSPPESKVGTGPKQQNVLREDRISDVVYSPPWIQK